jgi:hypothetical protein
MIDEDLIMTEFVKAARGPTYSPALSVEPIGGLKAVYLERPDDVSKASYPFILVDLTSIEKEAAWIIDDTQVDGSDKVIYSTNYELLISYHVYGSGARSIANQLEGYFRFETVRNNIQTITGGVVVTTLPIESVPQSLADKFVDSAIFSVLFAVTDSSADPNSGVIETLDLDGELIHVGYGDADSDNPDPSPVPVLVDTDYT